MNSEHIGPEVWSSAPWLQPLTGDLLRACAADVSPRARLMVSKNCMRGGNPCKAPRGGMPVGSVTLFKMGARNSSETGVVIQVGGQSE